MRDSSYDIGDFASALANAMAQQARREIAEYNATHPPRYLVVVKPVMGRRVRYYERHEWKWHKGQYDLFPVFRSKPSDDLLMRDHEWAKKIAAEIGGKVIDKMR